MELLYIANVRMPTEKAHGLQIAKMCEAFADAGAHVTLVVPQRENSIQEDIFSYYSLRHNFHIRYVRITDLIRLGRLGYWLNDISFLLRVLCSGIIWRRQEGILYTRDPLAGFLFSWYMPSVVFEIHDFPRGKFFIWRILYRRFWRVVSTNRWKAEQVRRVLGFPNEKIFIYPNGFDAASFKYETRLERQDLGLPLASNIVMYVGQLYGWKGAAVLLGAAKYIPEAWFIFIGGEEKDLNELRAQSKNLNNVIFFGRKPHLMIPQYLHAADILALPNSRTTEESEYGTSPIKLFEYLAAGKPIVASDLPSIREIVSDKEVVFANPDDPQDFARAIKGIMGDPLYAKSLGEAAFKKSSTFSWDQRAQSILGWLTSSIDDRISSVFN